MAAPHRVASTSAVVALVLATVWLFWPSSLGGATTYVATHGNSMEPEFSTGDLALLSAADSYSVGDIVAYHSDSMNTIVMHRINSVDADGFVTKGDNNDWLDEDRPTEDEILGRLFLGIPHGGTVLDALRSPAVLCGLVAAGLLALGATRDPRGRRTARWVRRRVAGLPTPTPLRARPSFSTSTRGSARQVAYGAGAVALGAAVGCGVLLAVPPTATETRTVAVTQQSQFSYTGTAVAGTTYPSGVIATGDTVWNRLVDDLTVSVTTSVTGPGVTDVAGSVRLDVVIQAPDGWSAVLASGPAVPLQNGTAAAAVGVDADDAAELLGRHYEEIGSSSGSATLTVTPVSEATGIVDGQVFTVDSVPGLAFALDEMALRPTSTEATDLAPTSQTTVEVSQVRPRTFPVLAASVPIGTARKVMGAILLLSLAALGAGAWIGRIGRGDVSTRFLVRHADRILPVESFTPGPAVVDVSDAESLHRVAERFDTVVLHHAGPDGDVFAVRDLDVTYRFVVPGVPGRAGGKPPVPARVPRTESAAPVAARVPRPRPAGLWGRAA